MAATDKQKAEEILRKRRLAAKGLVYPSESKESEQIAEEEREGEGAAVRGAVAASALRRSG